MTSDPLHGREGGVLIKRRLCYDKVDILGNISDVKAMIIDREPAFMVKLTCSHCFRGQR